MSDRPKTKTAQDALGACPRCGQRGKWWLNDVPLHGFCWGPDAKPHPEVRRLVPPPFNPYLPKQEVEP